MNRLITLSKAWSIDEALWVLWVYKYEHEEIYWRNFWTTPYEIGIVEEEDRSAMQVGVKFLGGPRGTQVCVGSLSMFVVDRILMRWRQNKVGWKWLLRFNPDTTTHIRDQLGQIKPDFRQQKLLPGFGDERDGHWEPSNDEQIVDYVQIGDDIYPILESGRQGCVVQRAKKPIRAVIKSSAENDDGAVHRWSSNGRINVCKEV